MHIAVCGYYGMGNFGDDVYLRTLQKRLDGHAVYPWLPQMSPDDTDAVIIGGGDLITPYSFNPYYFPAALLAYSSFPFEAMLRLFLRLSSQGYHLALIPVINHPTNGFSDFDMCNRLYQAKKARDPRASVESLPLLMELDVTYSIIQSMDMLISYKLNPSLAALRAGKPVFAFSMMNKVRSLLRQCGMEEYVCSYQEPEEVYWPRIEDFLEYGQTKAQAALPRIRQYERESVRQLHRLKTDIEQMPAASPVLMAV